jgi:hypothetical protein
VVFDFREQLTDDLDFLIPRTLDGRSKGGRCLPWCLAGRVNSRSIVDSPSKFLAPGSDGELAPGTDLWRKGLVYTTRAELWSQQSNQQDYRISVLFKKGVGAAQPFAGFNEVYRRVVAIADRRISQLTCPEKAEVPHPIILCQGWRWIGENIVTALISLSLRCSDQSLPHVQGEPAPTDEALLSPGGATLEELVRLAPHTAHEIYNEFDLTDPSTPHANVIAVSYGEPFSGDAAIDFLPFVERAERLARFYYSLLKTLGESGSQPFRIRCRQWFLARPTFVTIHICFDQ